MSQDLTDYEVSYNSRVPVSVLGYSLGTCQRVDRFGMIMQFLNIDLPGHEGCDAEFDVVTGKLRVLRWEGDEAIVCVELCSAGLVSA